MPARFTYVYEKANGTYKILTHHSSVLPEAATLVFYEWNDALHTKDPKTVAAMYDAKGVLIPTLSNKVRNTTETIEDYFKVRRGWAGPGLGMPLLLLSAVCPAAASDGARRRPLPS